MSRLILMQGNEAVVRGAIDAGMRFFAGYPITPSTEIAEGAAEQLPKVGGTFIQMEDEISSMAAVIGASAAGVKAMTATSGPGFSLKQENIGYASAAELPCVIVNVQRSGPSTGLPTSPSQADVMQARWGTHGDHPVIAVSPSSVEEAYTLAARSFYLAETYRVPVILLMDEIVGHMREGISVPENVPKAESWDPVHEEEGWLPYRCGEDLTPKIPGFGRGKRYHITGLIHDERGYPTSNPQVSEQFCTRLMQKIEKHEDDILQWDEEQLEDAEIAVVCFGGTARSVRQAVTAAREQGIRVGIFRPVSIWPFPEKALLEASKHLRHIVVAEHNYGQILLEVERIVKGNCTLSHIGKVNGTIIMPDEVLHHIRAAAGCGE